MLRLLLIALLALCVTPLRAPQPVVIAQAASIGWPTYHLDNARSGNDTGEAPFNIQGAIWHDNVGGTSLTLDGSVYGQALVYGGRVFVATENNSIYAFDETTGNRLWQALALATPASNGALSCGNIGPVVGITGTPVLDTAAGIIYAVGLTTTPLRYQLFARNLADGSQAAAPRDLVFADIDPRTAGQRGALALAGGSVYVPIGGRSGDCTNPNPYHPIVVRAPVPSGTPTEWNGQTGSQARAGIWAPSGEAIDGSGNVYVATGNGNVGGSPPCNNMSWDHGNGVVKLNSALTQVDFFAPYEWCSLASSDTDVGSIAPALLSGNKLFQTGKPGDGWLLDTTSLGGFASMATPSGNHLGSCRTFDAVFGGTAYDGTRVFVPCDGVGLVAVTITGNTFSVAWQSNNSAGITYNAGAPILAGGVVWSLAQGGGTLYGFDPVSGALKHSVSVCGTTRFASPSADSGRIFIPCTNGVEAIQFSSFTVTNTYYYPWYDHLSSPGFTNDNIHVVNPNGSPVSFSLTIPGRPGCVFTGTIAAGAAAYYGCPTGFGGPVVLQTSARVESTQRVQYFQSFNEVPALPSTAAATSLYFSWFDRVSSPGFMNDNIHVVNPGAGSTTVTANMPGCGPMSASIGPGAAGYFNCASGFGGPVTVNATSGVLATQRVQFYNSFNEVPAQSAANAATSLYFPWYDHASSPGFLNDNVHVVNPSGGSAAVTVNIPGCGAQVATVVAGGEVIFSCGSGFGGPVTVTSTGTPVLASQRVQFYQSFNEVNAQPAGSGGTTLYFSWFDRISDSGFLNDNVHVVNPTGGAASVTVSIPGCGPQNAGIVAGGEVVFSCASGFGGPVKITTTGALVLASQRVQYYQTFNEVSAQP
jgi:hypothetical protein